MQKIISQRHKFYITVAASVLGGVIIGLLIASYVLLKNKTAFCQASTAARAITLSQDQTISGIVSSVAASQITLKVNAIDRFNSQRQVTASVSIAISPNDKIVRFTRSANSQIFQPSASSISEIKAGDTISIKGLSDGSKIIYLPMKVTQ